MKVLNSVFVLFLFASCASAQTLPKPPATATVTVLQKKWRMDVRNPAVEKDPFQANRDRLQVEVQQRADARADAQANENRARQGEPASAPRVRVSARTAPRASGPTETGPRGVLVTYLYEAKVRNNGEKKIRALVWEYVFFEPGTETEVGRRRFLSRVSIGPEKTKTLVRRSASSPTGTVDASKAGKKPQDMYAERVVIRRVEYTDGSAWQSLN